MQRVAVVGCIGSGKSTVARALGKALGIEAFHLDGLWWQPGRYRITGPATVAARTMEPEQFRQLEMTITAGFSWIIDGDATNKDVRLSRADTVVFLDLPRWLCAWRVLKRHVRGSPEYPDGVRGSIRWTLLLLRWVWTTWPSRRRPALIRAIAEHAAGAHVVHIRSRRKVRVFLDGFTPELRSSSVYLGTHGGEGAGQSVGEGLKPPSGIGTRHVGYPLR